jgi:hypothetical protein
VKCQIFCRLSGIASVLGFLLVGVLLAYYLEINFCVKTLTPMAYAKTRSEKEVGNDSRQVGQASSWLVCRNRRPRVAGEETVPAPQLAAKTGRRAGGGDSPCGCSEREGGTPTAPGNQRMKVHPGMLMKRKEERYQVSGAKCQGQA